jgi:hypothetical protein
MKTSYVSGSNSFLAYNDGGLLNGVDYAANLIIFERYSNSFIEFTNEYGDLLLNQILVTAGNLTGSFSLTLQLTTRFNGQNVITPIWKRAYNAEDVLLEGMKFYQQAFNQPVLFGQKLTFYNSNEDVIDIRRVVLLFRPLVFQWLG